MDVASLSSKRISEFWNLTSLLKKGNIGKKLKRLSKVNRCLLSKLGEQMQVSYHPALALFLPQCYRQGCAGGQWMASYLYCLLGEGRVASISPQYKTRMHQHANYVGKKQTWFPSSILFLGWTRKRCVFAVPGTWQSLSKLLREVLMS